MVYDNKSLLFFMNCKNSFIKVFAATERNSCWFGVWRVEVDRNKILNKLAIFHKLRNGRVAKE